VGRCRCAATSSMASTPSPFRPSPATTDSRWMTTSTASTASESLWPTIPETVSPAADGVLFRSSPSTESTAPEERERVALSAEDAVAVPLLWRFAVCSAAPPRAESAASYVSMPSLPAFAVCEVSPRSLSASAASPVAAACSLRPSFCGFLFSVFGRHAFSGNAAECDTDIR